MLFLHPAEVIAYKYISMANNWILSKSHPVSKKAVPMTYSYIGLQLAFWKHTFNFSLEVRVSVENFHLLPPVKFIPPVGDDFLQIVGVKTIVEAAVFQRWGETNLLKSLV